MVHPDCYYEELGELFNPNLIQDTLDQGVSVTAKQEAILKFIIDNLDEQFISLLNTFSTKDTIVVRMAKDFGATSDEYDKYDRLQTQLREFES